MERGRRLASRGALLLADGLKALQLVLLRRAQRRLRTIRIREARLLLLLADLNVLHLRPADKEVAPRSLFSRRQRRLHQQASRHGRGMQPSQPCVLQ